jgi:ATP-dependent helicase/nuclease subunit A
MSEAKWTDAQLAAIRYRGKGLLLSAAAGSGKTATLTERLVSMLNFIAI